MSNTEWNVYRPLFWWKRFKLIDGSTDRVDLLMRRRASDGSWQYRRATGAEELEQDDARAW